MHANNAPLRGHKQQNYEGGIRTPFIVSWPARFKGGTKCDVPIISLDLQSIVREMGHTVAAIATTRDEAVRAARKTEPGLVLADIKLADGSSGIDAVRQILSEVQVPIVVVPGMPFGPIARIVSMPSTTWYVPNPTSTSSTPPKSRLSGPADRASAQPARR